jgi:hypothetical protein
VFLVVLIIDQDGYAQYADLNTYGGQVLSGRESSYYYSLPSNPQIPGAYTIRTFLISNLDSPQILTTVATSHAIIRYKIDKLGEGEENYRLHAESIDSSNNSVKIACLQLL